MSEGQADEKTKINQKKKKKTQNTGAGFSDLPWKIYISRFLSAWGDRLWSFGAGIFMVELAPENLRLVAIYGLVTSVSVILLGAAIGNWIDKSQRLFAAQTFLAVQNLATALACVILALYFAEAGKESWPLWLPDAIPIVTIIIADIAQLASVGSKIILEKDWIVIISRYFSP
jgi:iron-regulated transporter 1